MTFFFFLTGFLAFFFAILEFRELLVFKLFGFHLFPNIALLSLSFIGFRFSLVKQ
jgi:hypothetical protein|tara:strand:+ start:559 stop:723 length:165 start_codon:yes stop_codon:yes gene_type:complete